MLFDKFLTGFGWMILLLSTRHLPTNLKMLSMIIVLLLVNSIQCSKAMKIFFLFYHIYPT